MEGDSSHGSKGSKHGKMVTQMGRTLENYSNFSGGAYEVEELSEDKRLLRVNGKYLKKYKPMLQEIKINNN